MCSGKSVCIRKYVNNRFVILFPCILHLPVNQCEEGVVFSHSHVGSGMMFGSSLPYQDIPGFDFLSAEYFDSQPFAV